MRETLKNSEFYGRIMSVAGADPNSLVLVRIDADINRRQNRLFLPRATDRGKSSTPISIISEEEKGFFYAVG